MTVSYDATTATLTIVFAATEEQTLLRRYRARLREFLKRDTLSKEAVLRYWVDTNWTKAVRWTEEQIRLAREKAIANATPAQLEAATAASDTAVGFDPEA